MGMQRRLVEISQNTDQRVIEKCIDLLLSDPEMLYDRCDLEEFFMQEIPRKQKRGYISVFLIVEGNICKTLKGIIDIQFYFENRLLSVPEIGFWVVPEWRRQGLASWSLQKILKMYHQYDIFNASVTVDNYGSQALLKKNGFIIDSYDKETSTYLYKWVRSE